MSMLGFSESELAMFPAIFRYFFGTGDEGGVKKRLAEVPR